jgi:two-component system chemotaxis response regulator CheB
VIELVVIGTSAGGLAALNALFCDLGPHHPLPFAIVQHRGLEAPDDLASVMSRSISRPILEVQDKQPITRGRIHLAPSDYHLLVDRTHFALSTDPRVNSARPSIDVLFESAAQFYRDRLLALVLTGASSDGARGAARVRALGGHVIVQDPDEAEVPLMPRSALPHANHVFTLAQMARHLQLIAGETLIASQ